MKLEPTPHFKVKPKGLLILKRASSTFWRVSPKFGDLWRNVVDFFKLSISASFKAFSSLVFYFPFLTSKQYEFKKVPKMCSHVTHIWSEKWGKKLIRGIKNFWFRKYDNSAFFCSKNYVKSLKICLKIETNWQKKFFYRNFFLNFFNFQVNRFSQVLKIFT